MESMHLGESVSFLPVSSDLLVIIVTLFTARRASMFSRLNKFTFHLKCRWWHVLIHLISDRSARKPAFVLWLHVAISWTQTHGDHTGPIAFNEKNQFVWSFDVCTFKNMCFCLRIVHVQAGFKKAWNMYPQGLVRFLYSKWYPTQSSPLNMFCHVLTIYVGKKLIINPRKNSCLRRFVLQRYCLIMFLCNKDSNNIFLKALCWPLQ